MGGVLGGVYLWFAGLGGVLMRLVLTLLVSVLWSPATAAEPLSVPSGQLVLPYEFLWEDHQSEGTKGEAWLIMRYLTPSIGKAAGKVNFATAEADIAHLCTHIGLPLVQATGVVDEIIVNLMSAPIPRGVSDNGVTQFIGAFRVSTGVCEWTY